MRRALLLLCASLCCFSVCALFSRSSTTGSGFLGVFRSSNSQTHDTQVHHRRLGGPGSYPPRCIGKCGRCTPCRPVNVAVPPGGTPVTTGSLYYPEAWRCKCSNRLYIP